MNRESFCLHAVHISLEKWNIMNETKKKMLSQSDILNSQKLMVTGQTEKKVKHK